MPGLKVVLIVPGWFPPTNSQVTGAREWEEQLPGDLWHGGNACINKLSFLFACDPASFLRPTTRSASRSGNRDKLNRPLEGKGVCDGQEALCR